jgi:hypothetical protein
MKLVYIFCYLSFTFFVYFIETYNQKIIVTKGDNNIDVKSGLIFITRINQEPQEKESGKNSRK